MKMIIMLIIIVIIRIRIVIEIIILTIIIIILVIRKIIPMYQNDMTHLKIYCSTISHGEVWAS